MNIEAVQVEVSKLDLRPGSILVLRLPLVLNTVDARAVHETVKRILPAGVEIMTFRGDVGLEVLEPAASEPDTPTRRKRGSHAESSV